MSVLKNVKDFFSRNKFSIMLIPEKTSLKKTKTFLFNKVMIFIYSYSIILIVCGLFLSLIFPVEKIFKKENTFPSIYQSTEVVELSKRINKLLYEIEKLKKTNENLKKAIMLADSIQTPKSTSRKSNKNAGSLFFIFKQLIEKIFIKDLSFIKPINAFISREYKPDIGHLGIDFAVKIGTPIFATANGYILFADYTINDGYMIIIVHDKNYISVYKHCSALIKNIRDVVTQGEIIALSGNSGKLTTGPHLHFEIWKDGQTINPKSVFINF